MSYMDPLRLVGAVELFVLEDRIRRNWGWCICWALVMGDVVQRTVVGDVVVRLGVID